MTTTTFTNGVTLTDAGWFNDVNDAIYDDVYNVKNSTYGALGDGAADDTVAIQAAIDACNTAGGGIVFFPEGTYIASAIALQSYVRLVGAGFKKTILQHKSGTTTDFITLTDNNTDYFGIEDLYVKGNYVRDAASDSGTDATVPNGIDITRSADSTTYQTYGGQRLYFRNIIVQNFGGNGIHFEDSSGGGTAYIGDQRLENVYVGYCQGYGVYSNASSALVDSVWIGVHSYWNKKEGFLCRAASTNFISCKAFWNGEEIGSTPTRVALGTPASGWLIQDSQNCAFIGCEAQDNGLDGFKTATNSSAPTRLQFAACNSDTNLGSQFNFNTGNRIVASGTCTDRAALTASMVGVTTASAVSSFSGDFTVFGLDTDSSIAGTDVAVKINGVFVTPIRFVGTSQVAMTGGNVTTDTTQKILHITGYPYTNANAQLVGLRINSTATENIVEVGGGSSSFNAATEVRIRTGANTTTTTGTVRLTADTNGNVAVGTAAIATNATNGFLYIPSCAGTPTGTPTTKTGLVPLVIDTTNHKLYFYDGLWRDAGP